MGTKKRIGSAPHVFAVLTLLVLLSSLLTYVIPSGEFNRVKDAVTGLSTVVPGSFHSVQASPYAPWLIPQALFKAVATKSTATLLLFIFIIGGSFEIVMQSGAITALCGKLISVFKDKGLLIVPVFIVVFSVFGFTMGLTTAAIVFVPIGIAIARALGFDAMTGMAMVMLGTNAGFAAGVYNPFSVGIAQSIAQLPLYSGAWLRWLLLVFLLTATCLYVVRYARRAKGDSIALALPSAALWRQAQQSAGAHKLGPRELLVLLVFAAALAVITVGVSTLDWDMTELGIVFLVMGAAAGLASGFGINKTCSTFAAGCKNMMSGAIIICIAAAMRQVLTDGRILDAITNWLIGTIYHYPVWAQLMGMFYTNAALDPLITSGSAHAAVVMPIMVPMADGLGLSRQSAVFAFQLGDGLVNLTSPISTTLTSCLAVSQISYGKWLRFFLPLVLIFMLIGTGFILLAAAAGY